MYAWLILYHFIFFWRFYTHPYLLCTSELRSTFFPHWRWTGTRLAFRDELYYKYPACIPFLSTFYLPSRLVSLISHKSSINLSFIIYVYFILLHFLFGSFLAYLMFSKFFPELTSLFGAMTLTYAGYCIKPQTPCFVYTASWLPGMFLSGTTGDLSTAMALLGGYWPILVYVYPAALFLKPVEVLTGTLLALPQIIPFLWYWRRSVRWKTKIDRNLGKVPWWKLSDLVIPSDSYNQTNGVHFPEMAMYMGIAPFFIFHWSWWWIPLTLSVLIALGMIPPIQRIPSRSIYLIILSICFLVINRNLQNQVLLVLLNAFLLLNNTSIYPSFPFSQWWDKPSRIYPEADYTGYLTGKKIHDYQGAFALR